ncbi:MAG: rhomboid family intramembrane serine protease [Flavobacteriales bacterium]|jgi:membrane associated rhomboid family serine protease|nr:rhomboid family intramembrane serine protease [Flavobacteriales bacterium]|tara:strand:+ start:45 stop:704 length:660 start_codon:yes stop_codon:yes gene_type:complete
MNNFRPRRFNILPPIVKNLLIINGLLFLATITLMSQGINLKSILGLHHWQSPDFETWQIISHMFMHGDFTHLFFNMFAVWMFGAQLENLWGSKRFLNYYLMTGLGAAILHFSIFHFFELPSYNNDIQNILIIKHTVLGASGCLFGLLIAFGLLFPNTLLFFLFIPFPIKAKYFVIIYGIAELYYGLQNNPNDNIAHFAHLGGMLFGFLIIKYWQWNNKY